MIDATFDGYLAQARRGDAAAWGHLFDRVAGPVYAYLRGQSLTDPDDVAGETFLHMVRDIDRFDGTERQFRSWVLAIAHHRMLDSRRANTRRPVEAGEVADLAHPDMDEADVTVVEQDEWSAFAEHLSILTDEQRSVVLLRVAGDLTVEETAAVLGRNVGAVKALQHRAFVALRAHLSPARNPIGLPSAHTV